MNQNYQRCLDVMRDALVLQKDCSEGMYKALIESGISDITAVNFVNGVLRDISSGKKPEELLPTYYRISDDLLEHMRGVEIFNPLIKEFLSAMLRDAIYAFVTSAETANALYTEAVLLMIKSQGKGD